MLEALRRSLALRLAGWYTLVFSLAAAGLFWVLYVELARALEAREHAAVEQLAVRLGRIYDGGGVAALRAELNSNATPQVRAFFVRVITSADETVFASVPPDWVQTQIMSIPVARELGLVATREVHTVRIPQNALRDYAVATTRLIDGSLLQVGQNMDSRAVLFLPFRRVFLDVGVAALAVCAAAGTFLAWRATRPLRLVSQTARRIIETGDLSARVAGAAGTDELAVLVRQLNTLLERNAAHVQVLRGTLDSLAHDLRTPLTRLRATAEQAAQDGHEPGEARQALVECIEETDRLLHVLDTLLDISAAEGGALRLHRSAVDLHAAAERAADLYREVAEEGRIAVEVCVPAGLRADADPVRLAQALNNLLDNALKYTPAGGHVWVAAEARGAQVEVSVADDGPGVPPTEREAIFRRLYRGDASRSKRGLGLGLSLVKAVADSHGGSVRAEDRPGGGARFVLLLPTARG